jgi:DNA invertase Pin-like site-specific DNA recombinase
MAEIKSESVADFTSESAAGFARNPQLEQEFNSLQAQREACEAFINSQRHEGWVCLPASYDDGGFSGATMERPALQQLLADITAGRVDIVVVYKIDRLTRSLADFAKSAVYKQNQ